MTAESASCWEDKRTDETRQVEDLLKKHFRQADVYRYNSASIRVRVIDPAFETMSRDDRYGKIEKVLELLPAEIQSDIVTLLAFAPSDLDQSQRRLREQMLNVEFDRPSPSRL